MKLRYLKVYALLVVLALMAAMTGCSSSNTGTTPPPASGGSSGPGGAKPAAPVKIGFVSSFSGTYAAIAEDQWRAVQLATEQINAQGGLLGRKIELVKRDDKLNPGEAAKVTQDMIQNDKPDFIIGSISGATVLPMNDQAKKAGIPFFGIAQSDAVTTAKDRGQFSFHEALTPTMNGRALGKWIANNLGKKVYYLMPDYAFGKDNYNAINKALLQAGGAEVGVAWYPLGTSDFTPFIARIRAAKPDVVVTAALGNDQVNLLKQVQSFELNKEMKIFIVVTDIQGDAAAGFQNLQNTYGGASFYWELADKDPTAKAFVDAYVKKYGSPPSGYAGYAYSATKLIKLGAEKAGSIEPEKFSKALAGQKYNTYKGEQWIRACDQQSFQSIFITRGRTLEEAKKAGREQYGFREIVGVVQADESMERTCEELGYKH